MLSYPSESKPPQDSSNSAFKTSATRLFDSGPLPTIGKKPTVVSVEHTILVSEYGRPKNVIQSVVVSPNADVDKITVERAVQEFPGRVSSLGDVINFMGHKIETLNGLHSKLHCGAPEKKYCAEKEISCIGQRLSDIYSKWKVQVDAEITSQNHPIIWKWLQEKKSSLPLGSSASKQPLDLIPPPPPMPLQVFSMPGAPAPSSQNTLTGIMKRSVSDAPDSSPAPKRCRFGEVSERVFSDRHDEEQGVASYRVQRRPDGKDEEDICLLMLDISVRNAKLAKMRLDSAMEDYRSGYDGSEEVVSTMIRSVHYLCLCCNIFLVLTSRCKCSAYQLEKANARRLFSDHELWLSNLHWKGRRMDMGERVYQYCVGELKFWSK